MANTKAPLGTDPGGLNFTATASTPPTATAKSGSACATAVRTWGSTWRYSGESCGCEMADLDTKSSPSEDKKPRFSHIAVAIPVEGIAKLRLNRGRFADLVALTAKEKGGAEEAQSSRSLTPQVYADGESECRGDGNRG